MPDVSGLATATTAALGLSNLILVTPQKTVGYQPQNAPSYKGDTSTPPPALVFHYEGENVVTLESDITDHFIENNSAIQDQISLKPEVITVQGFVGELNDVAPPALQALKVVAEKLTAIGAYAPSLSATAALAYAEAAFLYNTAATVANSAVQAWSSINGGGDTSVINGNGLNSAKNQTKQQLYFQQLYGYWSNRTLFTIQTPWAIFQDCALKSVRAIQDAETNMITDFELQFKLMRFATTQFATFTFDSNDTQGRLQSQSGQEVDLGVSTPPKSSIPFSGAVQGIR